MLEKKNPKCRNKSNYYTLKLADEVAERRGKETGLKLTAYRCPDCNCWHLTKRGLYVGSYRVLKVTR